MAETKQPVTTWREQSIAHIQLNRPERANAVDDAMAGQVVAALRDAEGSTDVRVIILSATGRFFCAGSDLEHGGPAFKGPNVGGLPHDDPQAEMLVQLAAARRPVVVAVQGDALGGGIALAALGHLVVASEKARFCFTEMKVGLFPGPLFVLLQHIVGARLAFQWAILGENVTASEALQAHLVNKVVPHEEVAQAALDIALKLASFNPESLSVACQIAGRQWLLGSAPAPMSNYLDIWRLVVPSFSRPSVKEGVNAFLEKRQPNW